MSFLTTTIAAYVGHNTSANPAYNKANFPGNFSGITKVSVDGATLAVDSTRSDDSFNIVSPAHVPARSVKNHHPLWTGLDIAHIEPYNFGGFGGPDHPHRNFGINVNSAAYVGKVCDDLKAWGFDGIIIDWYGPNRIEDTITLKFQAKIATMSNFTFALMIDNTGGNNYTAASLATELQYINTQYFSDPNYRTIGGKKELVIWGPALSNADFLSAKGTAGLPAMYWNGQGPGSFGMSCFDGAFDWVQPFLHGVNSSDPHNIAAKSSFVGSANANLGKGSVVSISIGFCGHLTLPAGWSDGDFLPRDWGKCLLDQAAYVNSNFPASMLYCYWPTANGDLEEGTAFMWGVDNGIAVSMSLAGSVLSFSVAGGTGDESTISQYTILATPITDGNAAGIVAVKAVSDPKSIDLSTFSGWTAGVTYRLYVVAEGKALIINRWNATQSYVAGSGVGGGDTPPPPPPPTGGFLQLQSIPGYSDLQDSVLATESPSFALHAGHIAVNAGFGMVRCETFKGIYKDADTVPLPVSPIDGYTYQRSELNYLWTILNSADPKTLWLSGPDSLWFANWDVDQTTGLVTSSEWYRRSIDPSVNAKETKDGVIRVITVGQRRKSDLVMAAPASYEGVDQSIIVTDKALGSAFLSSLNDDAKFSAVQPEIIYMGEFIDGQAVPQPVSPADGHVYSYAETKFMHVWRWLPQGSTYGQPADTLNLIQLGPFTGSVSSLGVCSVQVSFIYNGGQNLTTPAGYGRIGVFAFCTRSAGPPTLPLSINFRELPLNLFVPGSTLRASTLLSVKTNTNEAVLTPEFFGPTLYADGSTVPFPISPVDGYQYTPQECQFVWNWAICSTGAVPPGGGDHDRMPVFYGAIDPATGHVSLQIWRLPPGGPYLDDDNTHARIVVLIVARRQANYSLIPDGYGINPGGSGGGGGGGGGASSVLVEIPLGVVDGANKSFSASQLPNPQASLQLYYKGKNQRPGVDYSISGTTITFVTAPS